MKHTIVDVGSNTIRLSVYRPLEDGKFELLFSEKEMAGLNNYIADGVMSQWGMERAAEALNQFVRTAEHLKLQNMHVFATASIRNIDNTQAVLDYLRKETGLSVEVISGEEEAMLGYYGAMCTMELKNGYLFDIGGGSTEVVTIRKGRFQSGISIPMGSLSLFNQHISKVLPKSGELQQIRSTILTVLSHSQLTQDRCPLICGVGGTARAVLKVVNEHYNHPRSNRTITIGELKEIATVLSKRDDYARKLILRRCPDRVHTVIPGLLLMEALCNRLCMQEIYISQYGVREGYLCHRILENTTSVIPKTES